MNGKKLYRSTTNKKLAGVCGGLEDYTGVDATVWRVGFILVAIPGGVPGILLYILMWLVVPQQDSL
jgi:phage shock protein C